MDNGFSFASVILSYFLVGGGMFTATLVAQQVKLPSEMAIYGVLAAGAFVGGFIAGRASRGQTILEPAIGAVAVVATIVGLAATTPIGKLIWALAQDQTMKFVGTVGLTGIAGSIFGSFLSEKLFGSATQSSIPWLLYTALAVFGACLLATLFASIVVLGHTGTESGVNRSPELGTAMLFGIGAGCLLAGLAVGVSAWTRPLIAAFLGSGAGLAGFFTLIARTQPVDKNTMIGFAMFAVGGAIVTLVGAGLGWAALGRRHAGVMTSARS